METPCKLVNDQKLQSDSFGWSGQFFQALGHVAPAAGVVTTMQFIASRAGSALPLASLLAGILALLLAYCLSLLTRKYHGASGYFQIHSRALGSKLGFITSWLFFLYEPLNSFTVLFGFGALVLEPFSDSYLGIHIPWWITVILGNVVILFVSLTNIRNSIRTTAILGLIELIVVFALGVLLIIRSDAPFQPNLFLPSASADGMGGLLFAFVFAFVSFAGFESGLPLTEETKNPSTATFKGLMFSVLLAGSFYIFMGYASVVGFGGGENTIAFAKAFSSASNPYGESLAIKAFGSIGPWIIFLAALNSTIACCISSHNSATRVFFALGRARVLPHQLGTVSHHNKVPVHATLFSGSITFLACLVLLFLSKDSGPVDWFGFCAVLTIIPLLIIHLMTCLSVYMAYRFKEKGDFHPLKHAVTPVITGLLVLLPLFGAVYYNLTPPFSYAPWVVGVWFVIGILVYKGLKIRSPHSLSALEAEMDRF